jgi:hypothetical protein
MEGPLLYELLDNRFARDPGFWLRALSSNGSNIHPRRALVQAVTVQHVAQHGDEGLLDLASGLLTNGAWIRDPLKLLKCLNRHGSGRCGRDAVVRFACRACAWAPPQWLGLQQQFLLVLHRGISGAACRAFQDKWQRDFPDRELCDASVVTAMLACGHEVPAHVSSPASLQRLIVGALSKGEVGAAQTLLDAGQVCVRDLWGQGWRRPLHRRQWLVDVKRRHRPTFVGRGGERFKTHHRRYRDGDGNVCVVRRAAGGERVKEVVQTAQGEVRWARRQSPYEWYVRHLREELLQLVAPLPVHPHLRQRVGWHLLNMFGVPPHPVGLSPLRRI